MKILVAANYRMRRLAYACVESAKRLGYSVILYDLGGLGFGKSFIVHDNAFQKKGFYRKIAHRRYCFGDHKPAIIKDCLRSFNEFIVYLDADTVLIDRIDGIIGDYDVGLTVRPKWEVEKVIKKAYDDNYFIYDGYVNAGVMCFNPTEATNRFLEQWEYKITELHDDQGAINDMLKKYFPLKNGQLIETQGIKIRTFDTMQYNYYYFHTPQNTKSYFAIQNDIKLKWQDARILHFKGKMRHEYSRIMSCLSMRHTDTHKSS